MTTNPIPKLPWRRFGDEKAKKDDFVFVALDGLNIVRRLENYLDFEWRTVIGAKYPMSKDDRWLYESELLETVPR